MPTETTKTIKLMPNDVIKVRNFPRPLFLEWFETFLKVSAARITQMMKTTSPAIKSLKGCVSKVIRISLYNKLIDIITGKSIGKNDQTLVSTSKASEVLSGLPFKRPQKAAKAL
ncbi:hypothetical protein EGY04_08210 [Enterobacter roggenkampii]|nr:hypothetical protein EGY04_08210 [Enterobacter roggenkampii]